ncbi:MAG: PEP/pyruvate-binding domain-containing protein [Acidimicrobiales bacterium]
MGRKAAVLGWAAGNGVRTPGGFVLPSDRFWEAVAVSGALERARYLESAALRLDPRHMLDLAASVAEALRAPAVASLAAEDAGAAFLTGLAPVCGVDPVTNRRDAGRLVCRSSAAMEDGRRAAFPGMFLSVLGIETPVALAAAIVECWRSAFSADAMRYLLRLRVEPVDLSLALMIQPQVEADWSGVFVSHGARADVSDAGTDAVVSGRPATVRARRESGRWCGLELAPSLEAPLEMVHRAAERLVRHVHAEVDVEFAVPAGGGEPVLLQCRPLTTTAAPGRRMVGMAVDPRVDDDSAGIAVVDRLTTADYGIVFRSAAVVMEQEASSLSHVAILCRELGVPLVCGVAGARSLIGRTVAVDSGTGEVEVVEGEEVAPRPPSVSSPTAPRERAMPAVELLLRVLAEARPGHPPAGEAARIAGRHAVVPHPVAAGDLEHLQRLGTELLGPSFSANDVLACRLR